MNFRRLIIIIMIFGQFLFAQNPEKTLPQNMISHMDYTSNVYSVVEIDPDDYIVGGGDQFLIQINHLNSTSYSIKISPVGDLLIPTVGQIHLSGMTFSRAVTEIKEKCKQKYSNAEINVDLVNVRDVKIPIFGAVQNPEMITMYTETDINRQTEQTVRSAETVQSIERGYVLPASLKLSDLLGLLTLHYLAKDYEIEVRGVNDTSIINIYQYYLYGDEDSNPNLYEIESIFIPFADIEKECVYLYSPINTRKIVPILPGETLQKFIERKIQLTDLSNYDMITIKRNNEIITSRSTKLKEQNIILQAGDELEVSSAKQIIVNGHVNKPGVYNYIQGHTVADYIAMAGGVTAAGSNKSTILIRGENKIRNAENKLLERGDVILVKRSVDHILVGNLTVLNFLITLASLTLSFIAAYNSI